MKIVHCTKWPRNKSSVQHATTEPTNRLVQDANIGLHQFDDLSPLVMLWLSRPQALADHMTSFDCEQVEVPRPTSSASASRPLATAYLRAYLVCCCLAAAILTWRHTAARQCAAAPLLAPASPALKRSLPAPHDWPAVRLQGAGPESLAEQEAEPEEVVQQLQVTHLLVRTAGADREELCARIELKLVPGRLAKMIQAVERVYPTIVQGPGAYAEGGSCSCVRPAEFSMHAALRCPCCVRVCCLCRLSECSMGAEANALLTQYARSFLASKPINAKQRASASS